MTAFCEALQDVRSQYVGYVPNFPGAHSQAVTLDELSTNLQEMVKMLREDGQPEFETEFIGTQMVLVA
ncbi:type II toxin-antitoxin system HicB family antitoxin [candidate division KSB3 bacterium]|uniref:Type II toxin-antitoxin system HicB family antitoxin n=1 Tax=candidate division KSB3 bacterium TaxID=2044937 RepID=A0A9D5Q741_9BACT|nr:type II toxin-antitoxin system HicB family antitoxin [candidate division KSB3 bacterium]MBD3326460.1 type II toxin-antitoxin system HicB family antitoxin [candidate division KSB3 bacterium]